MGVVACELVWELATPFGRAVDKVRDLAANLPRPAGPVVQSFGLYRYVWPRTDLLATATARFACLMLQRWAGKESAHLKEPIRAWLADQWAKRQLEIADVIEKLNGAVKEATREDPDAVFGAMVYPLQGLSLLAAMPRPRSTFWIRF